MNDLATEIERALGDGRVGWLSTLDDLRAALFAQAGSYSGRTLTDAQLSGAIRALGGGKIWRQVKLPVSAGPKLGGKLVRLWVLDPVRIADARERTPAELAGWYLAVKRGGASILTPVGT